MNYDYVLFLREKTLEYLPHTFVNINGKYNGRCPFCGDSHKSSTKKRGWWYADRDCSYYCFNCGTSMTGLKFLQTLSGQEYDDIKREYVRLFLKSGFAHSILANNDMQQLSAEPNIFDLKPVFKPEIKHPLSENAEQYLKNRMVDIAPFRRDDMFSFNSKKGEYILIPWIVNGIDAYYQLNDYKKIGSMKYVFPKNLKKLVYGLDNVDLSWQYIICFEGVYDSLFVKNAIASGTKSITDYQMRLITERYPNHKICISFDNDKPGIESMIKLIESGTDVHFFKWFDSDTKAKDINELVIEKNDVNLFTDRKKLETMILTPLQMKMWLIQNGLWFDVNKKPKSYRNCRQMKKYAVSPILDLQSRKSLFE